MKKTNLLLLSLLTATVFALTGCNGGGGGRSICQNCNPYPNGVVGISVSNPTPSFVFVSRKEVFLLVVNTIIHHCTR